MPGFASSTSHICHIFYLIYSTLHPRGVFTSRTGAQSIPSSRVALPTLACVRLIHEEVSAKVIRNMREIEEFDKEES